MVAERKKGLLSSSFKSSLILKCVRTCIIIMSCANFSAIMDLNDRLANASKPTLPDLPNLSKF